MKTTAILLSTIPALALAAPGAATETETLRWSECSDAVKGLAIQAFMERVEQEDLVVYSLQPDKFSGVCPRLDAFSIEKDLVEEEVARTEKENARRLAEARRNARGGPAARADGAAEYSFALGRLLDPEREIWLVNRFEPVSGAPQDLETGTSVVVSFEGTDKQGVLVDGQLLRGLLRPTGVYTVTNIYRSFGGDAEEGREYREFDRLRRFAWTGRPGEAAPEPKVELARPAPVYFRTYGINYLNAPTIFPLWLKARGGRFATKRNFFRTCEKCKGKGRWTEWEKDKSVQKVVSCPSCGGSGGVGVEKTYVILSDDAGRKPAAVSFE